MSSFLSFFPESFSTSPVTTAASTAKLFAPFRDFTLDVAETTTLKQVSEKTGLKNFILAFVNIDSRDVAGGNPSWAGSNDTSYHITPGKVNFREDQIKDLRAIGGDVSISFGGLLGQHEPSIAITDLTALVACYQRVVSAYQLTNIDFDIEGVEVLNVEANKRRGAAMKLLVEANPGLKVSLTLPVNTEGLAAGGLQLLQDYKDSGGPLHILNGMSMEFGWYHKEGFPMSESIIASCRGLERQADAMGWGPDLLLGTTPMIGQSYDIDEVIYPMDFSRICDYLLTNPRQYLLSFWSVDRDNGKGGIDRKATYDRSGIEISDFENTKICMAKLGHLIPEKPVVPTEPTPTEPTPTEPTPTEPTPTEPTPTEPTPTEPTPTEPTPTEPTPTEPTPTEPVPTEPDDPKNPTPKPPPSGGGGMFAGIDFYLVVALTVLFSQLF